jgi:hypothetical protein
MENPKFELTYSALKMFGKQLYSNVGSAISELVANGLDAKASQIYIAINVTNKHNATVEILDNGVGMSPEDIRNQYIKIGQNKRNAKTNEFLGRKGVGKLAALYLSDSFVILTKTVGQKPSSWKLDVSGMKDDELPELQYIDNILPDDLVCSELWEQQDSGTYIFLQNVDFQRFGAKAFESLKSKLSNYYLYNNLETNIKINVFDNEDNKGNFESIEKSIAFRNMVCIFTDDTDKFIELSHNRFRIPYEDKLKNTKEYEGTTEIKSFDSVIKDLPLKGEYSGIPYELKGWVGIHSSIDKETAEKNDSRYIKNQFYNPNQLRVYVRNKLGMSNMIEHLGITRAFANYIEGEVIFDILDDDNLEDIATAGRQSFDTQDERFVILREIMTKVGNALVGKRQSVADKIKEKKKETDDSISTKAKNIFSSEVHDEIEAISDITQKTKNELERSIVNKLEGNPKLSTKAQYTVFISHSSKDRFISDCIFNYLKSLGFKGDLTQPDKCEIFYSSSGMDSDNMEPLSKVIKDAIISKNNDILFLTSKNFMQSPFCLFEGGAAWATRAINEYKILSIKYDDIPTFLTNGKSEVVLNITSKEDFQLDGIRYNQIIGVVNRMIKHLNKNRIVTGEQQAPLLDKVDFPDKVQLKTTGKTEKDYMDSTFYSYWETYVLNECTSYF